jgi:hypothetical protein
VTVRLEENIVAKNEPPSTQFPVIDPAKPYAVPLKGLPLEQVPVTFICCVTPKALKKPLMQLPEMLAIAAFEDAWKLTPPSQLPFADTLTDGTQPVQKPFTQLPLIICVGIIAEPLQLTDWDSTASADVADAAKSKPETTAKLADTAQIE